MDIDTLLLNFVQKNGSDLFLNAGAPPILKREGAMVPLASNKLLPEDTESVAFHLMNAQDKSTFLKNKEINFAYEKDNIGRFRVNVYFHKNQCALVIRRIHGEIPSLEQLKLSNRLKNFIMAKRGLFLVVGSAGSGKSTSVAALLNYRNAMKDGHIISIEDPIEFIHTHKKSLISQREIGLDTLNFENAVQNALRQSPDVIHIGEIRTLEAMQFALTFAETGHLCLATMHATNTTQALDRMIHFYPTLARDQAWLDLSLNLTAIVAQRLVLGRNNKRVCAQEILVNSPVIAHHIRRGESEQLKEYMARNNQYGMKTFDQALFKLLIKEEISLEEALLHADSQNNIRLMFKLHQDSNALKATYPDKELALMKDYQYK